MKTTTSTDVRKNMRITKRELRELIREVLTEAAVQVIGQDEYKAEYGYTPKGRGTWFFGIGNKTYSFIGQYSEALADAKLLAKQKKIKTIKLEL
jgi:hypothetical protein